MISDLMDYLNNNLLIAHYCGFDISFPLPSYWTFDRLIDASFIGLDSTPISANISQNNPKSFLSNKFNPDHQPKADKDCKLGVHTASNQANEKNYEFYWGYKIHILVDYISGLPACEAGLAMNHDGKCYDQNRVKQKYCCPFKRSGKCPIDHANNIMAKRIGGAQNGLLSQMIYVFPLTAAVNILKPAIYDCPYQSSGGRHCICYYAWQPILPETEIL